VRLRDAGLSPHALADATRGILAQRWVRRICASCRRPAALRAEVLEAVHALSSA